MNIKYQTQLSNHPTITSPQSGFIFKLQPLFAKQVEQLEQQYNKGQPFPAALRELLYLAGSSCYVLDYGLTDTQQQMQQAARSWMTKFGRNRIISRPFYVIDVYNAVDQFLLVFLDEGSDNPTVYEAYLGSQVPDGENWLHSLDVSLSEFVNRGIAMLLKGYNPF